MKKPKPPTPPRELCSSFLNWILGIVSPSLLCLYSFNNRGNKKVIRYFQELAEYEIKLIEWKIEKRIATKEEYKWFARKKRKRELNE